jgi:ABC-type lipoprotein export system ATPase subunit
MNEPLEDGPLVLARDLHKAYLLGQKPLEVLRGVGLQLAAGDFLALRGASGAGKSTLLHLLGGLDRPNAGEVWFEGRNLAALGGGELARVRNRRMGFIFQAYHLLPELDALENVALPARMARVPAREARNRAQELLERVGLGDRLEHRPPELSGGEQQRVAIARALVNKPGLILADEPTGNLDSRTGESILELLRELRAELRATLVIATHDAHVASCSPRVLELVDGRLNHAG